MHRNSSHRPTANAPDTLNGMPNQPKTPNRAVRVADDDWDLYGQVCAAEGTNRTADLNAHIQRRIKAFLRRGGVLTTTKDA